MTDRKTHETVQRITDVLSEELFSLDDITKGVCLLHVAEFCLNIAMTRCDLSPDAVMEFARIVANDHRVCQ